MNTNVTRLVKAIFIIIIIITEVALEGISLLFMLMLLKKKKIFACIIHLGWSNNCILLKGETKGVSKTIHQI